MEGFAHVPEHNEPTIGDEPKLANKLLAFVLSGLFAKLTTICSYWFVKCLDSTQQLTLTKKVIKDVEDIGYIVERIVLDNASINVGMLKALAGGDQVEPVIVHPFDESRFLFTSFDFVHALKNALKQMMAMAMRDRHGIISGNYLKEIYLMQRDMVIKPVRGFWKKHVYPTSKELMQVGRCVRVFKDDLIGFLETLCELGGDVRWL